LHKILRINSISSGKRAGRAKPKMRKERGKEVFGTEVQNTGAKKQR